MPSPIRPRRPSRIATVVVTSVLSFFAIAASARIRFDLPVQPLADSLTTVGKLANLNVYFDPGLVDGLEAPALNAELSWEDALGRLLEGTRLQVLHVDESTVRITADPGGERKPGTYHPAPTVGPSVSPYLTDISPDATLSSEQSEVDRSGSTAEDRSGKDHEHTKELEEIVVTGSHLPPWAGQGAQVQIYGQQEISDSGRTTLTEFLNSIPSVAVASTDNGLQNGSTYGQTSVQLHGLPTGTTLILIDGRRVQSSGLSAAPGQLNAFDLNSIPLSAVERVEVVAEGSSAIYGSDAIAGVVNVILKKNVDGIAADVKYGRAAGGADEADVNVVAGRKSERGGVTVAAGFQRRSPLLGDERPVTATYTPPPAANYTISLCNPGNVFSLNGGPLPGAPDGQTFAAISPSAMGNPRRNGFQGTYGKLNSCSIVGEYDVVPPAQRFGATLAGHYHLSDSLEVFGQALGSHYKANIAQGPTYLYADASPFVEFTVPAANPYNPFGTSVGVGLAIAGVPGLAIDSSSTFGYALGGFRGKLSQAWNWETTIWAARDMTRTLVLRGFDSPSVEAALSSSDPATALNPFVAGPPASATVLNELTAGRLQANNRYIGQLIGVDASTRADLLDIPSGTLKAVFGVEAVRESISSSYSGYFTTVLSGVTDANDSRKTLSAYAEMRVPVLRAAQAGGPDKLTLIVAGREDHYYDFGGQFTPQYGVEFRPMDSILLRATYARAFRAPSLIELYSPVNSYTAVIHDPLQDANYRVNDATEGGNLHLHPETGSSKSIGFLYSDQVASRFHFGATWWEIHEANSVQSFDAQTVIDNSELFPNAVVRDASGHITQIDTQFANFGRISVRGIDYQLSSRVANALGEFSPTLNISQTLSYKTQLVPGAPELQRAGNAYDDGNWAPKWKATASLAWRGGRFRGHLAARYVGRYRDYDAMDFIAGQTLVDASLTVDMAQWMPAEHTEGGQPSVTIGAVNLLDRQPQTSNYGFGYFGYDPTQSDVRGRFVYLQIGFRW